MAKRLLVSTLAALLLLSSIPSVTSAAQTPPPEKGLLITPIRQYLSADAGETIKSSIDIANLTDKPLNVTLSVKQFSVSDYVYTYKFDKPENDWLTISTKQTVLQPNRTQTIPYTIAVPAKSPPGGNYYTLFASADLRPAVDSTIQATDLVYLTVNGKLTSVSHLEDSSIRWFSIGGDIPFTLQPINTGNVHSLVSVSSQLHGLFVPPPRTSVPYVLMPGKVRSLTDTISHPVLPGIYLAEYGYRTDAGWIIKESHPIIFIPPWFIAFLLAGFLIFGKFWQRKRKNTDGTPAEDIQ